MSESQIFIKGLQGTTKTIDIDLKSTVAQLREVVAKKFGYTVEETRLIYGGKDLSNEDHQQLPIYELGIQKQSTIFLVFRLKGGAPFEISVILANENSIGVQIEPEDTIL